MKDLYIKLTRERSPEFQQMTKIYIDNGYKQVSKSCLNKKGIYHLQQMFENYNYFKSKGKNVLCPTKLQNDVLIFDYLQGRSLCNQLLECITQKKRDKFIQILFEYKKFVYNFGDDKEILTLSEDFVKVFGNVHLSQKIGARHLNIDLVFENLIERNNQYLAIDYEWIFNFVIPYEFVFYRAIYGLFSRYSKEVKNFIEIGTLYNLFEITQEDIKNFEIMDRNFLSYVYGKKYNYDLILLNYKKEGFKVKELFAETMKRGSVIAQLYIDTGTGFNPKQCVEQKISFTENKKVEFDFALDDMVKNVRFDPSLNAVMIYIDSIVGITKDEQKFTIEEYTSNASFVIENYLFFKKDDPQIMIQNVEKFRRIIINIIYITQDMFEMDEKLDNKLLKDNYTKELEKNERLIKSNKDLQKMNNIYIDMINELRKNRQ